MTGAVAVLVSTTGAAAGGVSGVIAPAALSWTDIYAEDSGSTQSVLITGITAPIQVVASKTGGAKLAYILNGTYSTYIGPFIVHGDDTLGWSVISTSIADQSGIIVVTNITAGTTLDNFNYTVFSSRGSRL